MAEPRSGALRFRLIGSFAAWRGDEPVAPAELGSRKGRTLLAVLLLHPDGAVSADRMIDVLWGDDPPPNAARNVASLVSRLRSTLGPDVIEGSSGVYRLHPGARLDTDVAEARRLVREGRARLDRHEPMLAATASERAIAILGTGSLLTDEHDAEWLEPHRAALATLRREARRTSWEAALAIGDAMAALRAAQDAVAEDPLDEEAWRAVMLADHQLGATGEALRAYERLRGILADELGTDPSPLTKDLHLSLLRDDGAVATPSARAAGASTTGVVPRSATLLPPGPRSGGDGAAADAGEVAFVGRDIEVARLEERWAAAASGHPCLVLLIGEAGVGKTRLSQRLVATAEATGGASVAARCYEAERSLFLGPVVEVVRDLTRRWPPARIREAAGPWGGVLVDVLPELAPVVHHEHLRERASPEVERRRTFQALTALFAGLSAEQPLLVLLDDLHNAASSTVELLHYLQRHAAGARLLVVGTVRVEEGQQVVSDLAPVAERVVVGPLPEAAVSELVERAGAGRLLDRILSMTRGHTLSVVETLAALADVGVEVDEPPVPRSLQDAVLQRVARAGPDVEEFLRAAATLGSTFDLSVAASLLGLELAEAARRAERAATARLLTVAGDRFAFSNDLIQEIVHRSTPAPTRALRHAKAAQLLAGQPEAVARHAAAAADWPRAFDAYLEAAETAARRYANRDAEQLLERAIEAGSAADDPTGVGRARLARADVREALADYAGALEDLEAAAELARASARPDLEAAALRALGGDVIVGLGRPSTDCLPYLEVGLDVAESAGLGRIEVELMGRIAVVWSSRARFELASQMADRALARAQQLEDDRALALALDAVKNVSAYTGDVDRLEQVLPDLERLLRSAGDLALLQWCVFESVIPHLARGRWGEAGLVLERALALNRRTGHPWGSLFLAQRSWLHRSRGDYGRAIDDARTAGRADVSARHPWWIAFSHAMLGWALSDAGLTDQAVATLEDGVAVVERDGMESYLLRCISHLALALWRAGEVAESERCLVRAEHLLDGITTPPDRAFLHAAHAYDAVARLRLARGEPVAARRLLDVVRGPAEAVGWVEVVAADRLLRGRCHLVEGGVEAARAELTEGLRIAESSGLRPLAWELHGAMCHLERRAPVTGGSPDHERAAAEHARAAADHLAVIAGSITAPDVRAAFLAAGERRQREVTGERPN